MNASKGKPVDSDESDGESTTEENRDAEQVPLIPREQLIGVCGDMSTSSDNGASHPFHPKVSYLSERQIEIRVAPEFQAVIPPFNPTQELSEYDDVLIFNPHNISEEALDDYIRSVDQLVRTNVKEFEISRFKERALEILHESEYDPVLALLSVREEISWRCT